MKKAIALLLVFAMLLSLAACAETTGNQEKMTEETTAPVERAPAMFGPAPRDEYEQAVWYGLLPEELAAADPDSTVVTWKQYSTMVLRVMELIGKNQVDAWKKQAQNALICDEKMTRDQACLSLNYARNIVQEFSEEWFQPDSAIEPENIFDVVGELDGWDYVPIEGNDYMQLAFADKDGEHYEDYYNFINFAIACCHELVSYGSMEPLLDARKNINDPLTLRDAMLSAVRFYESEPKVVEELWREWYDKLEAEAEGYGEAAEITEMRERILNSSTTIVKGSKYIPGETYSGTAYYVSNSGDDNANGRSPETAWATLEKVASIDYGYGDAVFFERGGMWRGKLVMPDSTGVTLSAYGEGAKPIITLSPENAADPAKWELYHEGGNGEKIWKFYRDMTDCALIVFDDTDTALKTFALWSGSQWQNEDGTPYDVKTALVEDMTFFSEDRKLEGGRDFHLNGEQEGTAPGPLYLRCDAGNPGSLYQSVELCAMDADNFGSILRPAWESTVDNLSIKYFPLGAVMPANRSCTIQNCELAWGGGCAQIMEDGRVTGRMGDALCSDWVNDLNVRNNYIHHHFTHAQTLEYDAGLDIHGDTDPIRNVSFTGNLVDGGLGLMFRYDTDIFENVLVSGNIFNRTGTGWSARSALGQVQWMEGEMLRPLYFFKGVAFADSEISDNRFYYPSQFFLQGSIATEDLPKFSGNTYYMAENTLAFALWQSDPQKDALRPVYREEAESFLRTVLKDETSTIVYGQ